MRIYVYIYVFIHIHIYVSIVITEFSDVSPHKKTKKKIESLSKESKNSRTHANIQNDRAIFRDPKTGCSGWYYGFRSSFSGLRCPVMVLSVHQKYIETNNQNTTHTHTDRKTDTTNQPTKQQATQLYNYNNNYIIFSLKCNVIFFSVFTPFLLNLKLILF